MLKLFLNSSCDKKLPSGFSTSFTVTTPSSNHGFQNNVALSMVIDLLFQRTNSFCKASDSRKLERVQERALRAIYCDSNSTYPELLQRAKLPNLI